MPDWLILPAIFGLVGAYAFFTFRRIIRLERESPTTLKDLFVGVAGIAGFIASIWVIRRLASLFSIPFSAILIGLVAILIAYWWLADRPVRIARRAFVPGRACVSCNRSLRRKRLYQAMFEGAEWDGSWCYRCECGVLTLFRADGSSREIEDRSGSTWLNRSRLRR